MGRPIAAALLLVPHIGCNGEAPPQLAVVNKVGDDYCGCLLYPQKMVAYLAMVMADLGRPARSDFPPYPVGCCSSASLRRHRKQASRFLGFFARLHWGHESRSWRAIAPLSSTSSGL